MAKQLERRFYHQGQLDGLCGLYALMNAVEWIQGPLSISGLEAHWKRLIEVSSEQLSLPEIIVEGMNGYDLAVVSRRFLGEVGITRKVPFYKRPTVLIEEFIQALQVHLKQGRRAVILGVTGDIDHWTLVVEVSRNKLILHDSDGVHHLHIPALSTPASTKTRYVVHPTTAAFLSAKVVKPVPEIQGGRK